MKDDPCKVCDFGFIVSLEWWESWVKYATDQSGTVQKPYKMGNDKHLFSFEITIKEYKVIHPKAWDVFKETYDFRPELLAFIIDEKPDFLPTNITLSSSNKHIDSIGISKKSTLRQLRSYLSYKYDKNFDRDLIQFGGTNLDENNKTMEQLGIIQNSKINIPCLEYRVNEGKSKQFSRPDKINTTNIKYPYSEAQGYRQEDYIEPDPAPITKKPEVPESRVRELVTKSIQEPYFELPLLLISQISSNLQMMFDDFLNP